MILFHKIYYMASINVNYNSVYPDSCLVFHHRSRVLICRSLAFGMRLFDNIHSYNISTIVPNHVLFCIHVCMQIYIYIRIYRHTVFIRLNSSVPNHMFMITYIYMYAYILCSSLYIDHRYYHHILLVVFSASPCPPTRS